LPAAGHMLLLDAPHTVSTAINRAMGLPRRPGWTAKAWATRYGLPSSPIPAAS
jgi:hypothetical protein